MEHASGHTFNPADSYHEVVSAIFYSRRHAAESYRLVENRLRAFQQLDIFTSLVGGLGSSLLAAFERSPKLVKEVTFPKARVFGTARACESIRVIRSPVTQTVTYVISGRKQDPTFSDFEISSQDLRFVEQVVDNIVRRFQGSLRMKEVQAILNGCISLARPVLVPFPSPAFLSFRGPGISIRLLLRTIQKISLQDDWSVVELGQGIVIMQQLFRKSKNIRSAA